MGGFRDLLVWRKGMALAEAVYRAARALPAEERLALGDQLRRAAVSAGELEKRFFSQDHLVECTEIERGSRSFQAAQSVQRDLFRNLRKEPFQL